jgi:hypothetical protein
MRFATISSRPNLLFNQSTVPEQSASENTTLKAAAQLLEKFLVTLPEISTSVLWLSINVNVR